MMSPDQALRQLLYVIDTYGTSLTGEDVRWAFKAKSTQKNVVAWVEEYLGQETLLSKEEAELYSELEENGVARDIASSHDLSTTRSFLDDEITSALRTLKDSTSTISRHNRLLKLQEEAVATLRKSNEEAWGQAKRTIGQNQKKRLREKRNVDFAVEELMQTTTSNASAVLHQVQVINATLPSTIAEILRKDDRLLARLDQTAGGVEITNDDERQITTTQILCTKHSAYIADQIRSHLDLIYLETCRLPPDHSVVQDEDDGDVELSLVAELDTLYTEVSVVAEMFTAQAFGTPLIETLKRRKDLNNKNVKLILDYVAASIAHLVDKADHMIRRAQIHGSHVAAVIVVSSHLDALKKVGTVSSVASMDAAAPGTADKTAQQHITSISMASEGHAYDSEISSEKGVHRLLHILGIPPLDITESRDIQETLDVAASNRLQRIGNGSSRLESTIDSVLASHLNESFSAQQLLLDSLLADTTHRTVQMFNEETRSRIKALELSVGTIGAGMANLNLENLHVANKEREQFVKTWDL